MPWRTDTPTKHRRIQGIRASDPCLSCTNLATVSFNRWNASCNVRARPIMSEVGGHAVLGVQRETAR
jgi:hypothetical protein